MTTPFKIRKLTEEDLSAWKILWKEYLHFYGATLSDEITNHTFHKLISADNDAGAFVICDETNKSIGFLHYILQGNTWSLYPKCYLQDLYVSESFRKNGCARLLIEHLDCLAKKNKWSGIYWITKHDNITARSLYDKIAKKTDWVRYEL